MKDRKTPDTRSVNWKEIRKRLEKVRSVIEEGWTPGPEEEKKVLRQRALALAKEPEREGTEEGIEIVEFLLARERYGIDASYVREVYPLNALTPVPCTPPFVLGMINVRGQIVSVIDMKKFFDLPDRGLGDLNKVIILRSEAMEFGILADEIVGMARLRPEELQSSLPTLTGIREEYLKGIAKNTMVVLDAERLLADKKLVVNEQV